MSATLTRMKTIDIEKLSRDLGCPVIPLAAVQPESVKNFRKKLEALLSSEVPAPSPLIRYSPEIESCIGDWSGKLSGPASELGVAERFIAIALLEEDPFITEHFGPLVGEKAIEKSVSSISDIAGTTVTASLRGRGREKAAYPG